MRTDSPFAFICRVARHGRRALPAALALALLPSAPAPAQPGIPVPQLWTGTVVVPEGMEPGLTAERLELRVFELTTDEEVAELIAHLRRGQMQARDKMRTLEANGFLTAGKLASAEVTVIRAMDLENGRRRVRVYCDFPIRLFAKDVPRDTRIRPFGFLELEVDSSGVGGTGWLVPAASPGIAEDGLHIDNPDIPPLKVVDVTSDRPPAPPAQP